MAENVPRCKVVITGESYDAFAIGAVGDQSAITLYPHATSYESTFAQKHCAEYLHKMAADQGSSGARLLHAMRESGIELAMVQLKLAVFDGMQFIQHQTRIKALTSEILYTKLAAMLEKTGVPTAPIQSMHGSASGNTLAAPTASAPTPQTTQHVSKLMPQRREVKITTVVQGGGAQDQLQDKMKEMLKDPELLRNGITKPILMTTKKAGAVVKALDGMTEEEIMDRDIDALTSGYAPVTEGSGVAHRIPTKDIEIDTTPLDIEGIDLGGVTPTAAPEGAPEVEEEIAFDGEMEVELGEPTSLPPAPNVAVVSGDAGETLGNATASLSANAQAALKYQRFEHQANQAVDGLTEDLFLNATKLSRDAGNDSQGMEGHTSTSSQGRTRIKTAISGEGRGFKGGDRPKTERDLRRGRN